MTQKWGVLPDEIRDRTRRLEWLNQINFRGRISGHRPFPIDFSLVPPTGPQASTDLPRFRAFVDAWRDFEMPQTVRYQAADLRGIGKVEIPVRVVISDVDTMICLLSEAERRDAEKALSRVRRVIAVDDRAKDAVIRALPRLLSLSEYELDDLCQVLPQLHRGIGYGKYLRAIPLRGVGTKFIEDNEVLLEMLLGSLHIPSPGDVGGLDSWLSVIPKPTGSILVRPLCAKTRAKMLGVSAVWVSGQDLLNAALPGNRVLVVENEQAAFAVPELEDTICIGGAGKQLNWLSAEWAQQMRCGYWGDIDSHGYHMLELARRCIPTVESILMDIATIEAHKSLFSREAESFSGELGGWLTPQEQVALNLVRQRPPAANRLEQEKLHSEWVLRRLQAWHQAR